MNYKLTIESEISNENLNIIEDGIRQFGLSKTSEENIPINILLKDEDGKVIGGLLGNHNSNWLYISSLWIDSIHRGKGYGRQMMLAVEEEVVKRGVTNAYLQTIHSSGFYKELGYEIFAVIENSPTGFNMYYLRKSLR